MRGGDRMDIKDLIKKKRLEKGLTMKELGAKVGVSDATISRWESGEIENMKRNGIIKLGKVLDIEPSELMGWNVVPIKKEDLTEKYRRISVYGTVPAGVPIEALQDIVDFEDISLEDFNPNYEYIGLKVHGDSMYPKYLEGDTIIVEINPSPENNMDCVIYVNGYNATLKTLIYNTDGTITLKPLNANYPPKTYGKKDDEIKVLGIVREIRRSVNY